MNKLFGTVAAATMMAAFAAPALAQMDVATMTCGAFFAMDDAGRADGLNAIMNFVKDAANTEAAGTAAETMANMSNSDAMAMVEKACEGQVVDTNLLSVLSKG